MNDSVLSRMIRGEKICLDNFDYPEDVYEFIDYYEMNLYSYTSNPCILDKINQLQRINSDNIKCFSNEISRICCELEKNSVEYCILVGIPFALRYHKKPFIRLQEDIDFFIDIDDMYEISRIMKNLHYNMWNYDEKKKHITFINEGKTGCDTSRNGRCAVKFYKRLSDPQFYDVKFRDVKKYIEEYQGYKVLSPEMTFAHLLMHAHYYDFHPKILCDIFAIVRSGIIDKVKLRNTIVEFRLERLNSVVMGILERVGVFKENGRIGNDISFICDILSSEVYWTKIFVRLNRYDLTLFRCYVYDPIKYKQIYQSVVNENMERRVSAMRSEFNL